ncbi:YfhO family protein, partial [bacterium]|nr:YfhO family protein [bacterium]
MARKGPRPTVPVDAIEAPAVGPDWLRRPWVRWLVLAAAVWLLVAVLYPGPVFLGETFRSADAGNADMFARVGDAARARGEYPHWSPYLFCGMPTFGSSAYVPGLYPPAALFAFLQGSLGLPPLTWMIGHLVFGGLGMVWLLSRWRLPVPSLLLGAALFLLFPQVVAWGVHGHGSKLGAAMYLPWIAGWTLRALDGAGLRATGMLGLLLGLQLLRAHPQISYYTLGVSAWLAIWGTVRPFAAAAKELPFAVRARRLAGVAGGIALGFLIAAVLLVPVQDYARISIRGQDPSGGGGVGLDYATGWALAPAELGTFVLPAAAGFGQATYVGLMPFNDYPNYYGFLWLTLAALGFARGGRSLWGALIAVSVLAVFVSFGTFGFGLYELLYSALPYFNKLRVPSMILVIPAFALAVLAARGLARLSAGVPPSGRPLLLPAALGVLGLLLLAGGGASLFEGPYRASLQSLAAAAERQSPPVLLDAAWTLHRASLVRIGLVLLAAAGAVLLAARNAAFRARGLAWALLALAVVDLLGVDRLVVRPESGLLAVGRGADGQARLVAAPQLQVEPAAARDLGPASGAAELAAAAGHDRIWPLGEHQQRNTWMADGIRSLGGYHAAKLAGYEAVRKRLYGDPPAGRLANWLGARLVVLDGRLAPDQLPLLAELGCEVEPEPLAAGDVWAYRNRSALPRARLLSAWAPAPPAGAGALGSFLDGVQSGRIDVAQVVHLDRAPQPAPSIADGPLPVPQFSEDGLDRVVLRTAAATPAVLVLADMNAPGWTVRIDGSPAELLTADMVLRAVALPAGEHTVEFSYRDGSYRR